MRLHALLGAALILALMALPSSRVGADAAQWRKKLSSNDPDELYQVLREIPKRGDESAGLPLLEVGVATKHPHLDKMAWQSERQFVKFCVSQELGHPIGMSLPVKVVLDLEDIQISIHRFRGLVNFP